MYKIIIGVLLVMLSNTLLGATIAKLKKKFNKKNLINGLFKATCIILAVAFMYVCSYLNPDIMVLNINGLEVNLIDGIKIIGVAGIVYYGGQSLKKLAEILKVSTALSIDEDKKIEK